MPAVDVAYTVTGEGPPLYLVHGIGSRRATWDAMLPALAEHFTCVAYDLRGHGDSPVPPVPYSLDELVDDLGAELELFERALAIQEAAHGPAHVKWYMLSSLGSAYSDLGDAARAKELHERAHVLCERE